MYKKFFINGKSAAIYIIVMSVIVLLTSIIMFSLRLLGMHFFALGIIFSVIWIILFIVLLLQPFYVKIIDDEIKETNIFGKVKKSFLVKSILEIYIYDLYMRAISGDYLCLKFSCRKTDNEDYNFLLQDDDIILIKYTAEICEFIKTLTNLPILDKRMK